jgi:hypothetical protein
MKNNRFIYGTKSRPLINTLEKVYLAQLQAGHSAMKNNHNYIIKKWKHKIALKLIEFTMTRQAVFWRLKLAPKKR